MQFQRRKEERGWDPGPWTPLRPVGRRPLLRRREAAVKAWSSSYNGKREKGTGRGPRQDHNPEPGAQETLRTGTSDCFRKKWLTLGSTLWASYNRA